MEKAAGRRVTFYTLGCKLNYAESNALGDLLVQEGHRIVPFGQEADVNVINTCSVTDHADRKCRKVVREALYHSPGSQVVVVGCYAQLKPAEILAIPGVNLVLGAGDKFDLATFVAKLDARTRMSTTTSDVKALTSFHPSSILGDRTRVFLKVQDGCDYNCSFCTIPLARGGSRSQPVADVIAQMQTLVNQDIPEIVLTGINLGDYGLMADSEGVLRQQSSLLALCQAIDSKGWAVRVRLSSIEPNLLSDELIALVARSATFAPHFHLPLQAGSDAVLGRMRRRYKSTHYRDRVAVIKHAMPDAAIGCDVIVGFPGETESDFAATVDLLTDLEVSYLHVFPFSERANTLAATLAGRVPERVRTERVKVLTDLSGRKMQDFYRRHLGQVRPVVFERESREGQMAGYTDNYIRVTAAYDPLVVGTLVEYALSYISDKGQVFGLPADQMTQSQLVTDLQVLG
jgi:threonylcarbamoyladenosine tRNA methylthiotransferase MtaB